jgi:hypothetical protein
MDANPAVARRHASRREVLGALGTGLLAAVAGCAGGATPGRSAEEEAELVSETLRVPAGAYEARGFSLDGERWLTVGANLSDRPVDVKQDGPAVDVFVMRPRAAARYRRGESFEYLEGVSMPDVVNGEVAATVPAGEYELVVDNTNRGPGAPGESAVDAVIDVTVTAATEREDGGSGVRPGGLTE